MPEAKLKYQPKAGARRSKEDRETQERAEAERERENARLLAAESSRGDVTYKGRGRGRGRGGAFRGGLSGWRNDARPSAGASGFLGGPSHTDALSANTSGPIRSTFLSDNRQPRSETNTGIKTEGGQTGPKNPKVKKEEGQIRFDLISDDETDDDTGGGKIDINRIGEIDDGEEKPVRVPRTEHVDRVVGVNTDASSATSAKIREKAKETADGNLQLPSLDEIVEGAEENKTRGKEVELPKEERRWQGVYDDSEEEDEAGMMNADAGTSAPSTAVQAADPATHVADTSTRQPEQDSVVERNEEDGLPIRLEKRAQRSRYAHLIDEPVLQTDEDRAEWNRYKRGLIAVAEELGPSPHATPTKPLAVVDTAGDTKMPIGENRKNDRRNELTYWFQLPPRIPKLVPAPGASGDDGDTRVNMEARPTEPVAEPSSSEKVALSSFKPSPPKAKPSNPTAQSGPSNTPQIKIEDDEAPPLPIPLTQQEQLLSNCLDSTEKEEFEGQFGTLTVYEDGVAIMDWGGIEHVVGKGIFSQQLQEVLVTDVGGDLARSMGQLSGCFVVQPEWEQLMAVANDGESSDDDDE